MDFLYPSVAFRENGFHFREDRFHLTCHPLPHFWNLVLQIVSLRKTRWVLCLCVLPWGAVRVWGRKLAAFESPSGKGEKYMAGEVLQSPPISADTLSGGILKVLLPSVALFHWLLNCFYNVRLFFLVYFLRCPSLSESHLFCSILALFLLLVVFFSYVLLDIRHPLLLFSPFLLRMSSYSYRAYSSVFHYFFFSLSLFI